MFFDSAAEEKIDVNLLQKNISSKPDEFKNIFVRRFTHVKNLGSDVLHEYLHVILEDNSTDKWTRVIVERQAGKFVLGEAHDQVIVRRWPAGKGYKDHDKLEPGYFPFNLEVMMSSGSSGSSGRNVRDWPLPLVTRSFQKRDFSVELLAQLLCSCHKDRPYYTPNKWNCYWFADRVFESHRVRIGHFVDNRWKHANWKGDISKILSPERWSNAVKEAYKAFKTVIDSIPINNPGGGHLTDHPAVSQTEQHTQYGQELKGFHADVFVDTLRKELSKELDEITQDEEEQMAADIADYHGSIEQCIAAETERDDFEANLEVGKKIAYTQGWNPQNKSGPEEVFLVGPTEDQLSRLEQSLFAFLGRLAMELD